MFLLVKGRIQTAEPSVAFCKHGEEGELSLTSRYIAFSVSEDLSTVFAAGAMGVDLRKQAVSLKFYVLSSLFRRWKLETQVHIKY